MKYKKSKHWPKTGAIKHFFLGGYAHDKEFVLLETGPNRYKYNQIKVRENNGRLSFNTRDKNGGWASLSDVETIKVMIQILRNQDESISNSLTGADTTSVPTSIC